MSIALVHLGWMMLMTTPRAVELSICMGVGGFGCPSSVSRCSCGIASRALVYSAPSLALAAEDMTGLMICVRVKTVPLLQGDGSSSDRKKCPPALLRAFVSDR